MDFYLFVQFLISLGSSCWFRLCRAVRLSPELLQPATSSHSLQAVASASNRWMNGATNGELSNTQHQQQPATSTLDRSLGWCVHRKPNEQKKQMHIWPPEMNTGLIVVDYCNASGNVNIFTAALWWWFDLFGYLCMVWRVVKGRGSRVN